LLNFIHGVAAGAGPVDYLLGKDRQREGASVLQGKPEEVRELIDASPYVKKYLRGAVIRGGGPAAGSA
jgi:hypothetical protein